MFTWQNLITSEILPLVIGDHFWENYLRDVVCFETSPTGIHLAIFVEPYLGYILDGRKTIESRFGMKKGAPYEQIAPGDLILLKKSGGPITGLCNVSDVWFYTLNPESWKKLRKEFTYAMCAQDPEFWKRRASASFATLMHIVSVKPIKPIAFPKNDRRGWVVLRPPLINDKGTTFL
jgi:ASC-1-like (ASCH) protein